jgi:hypothetical protein
MNVVLQICNLMSWIFLHSFLMVLFVLYLQTSLHALSLQRMGDVLNTFDKTTTLKDPESDHDFSSFTLTHCK